MPSLRPEVDPDGLLEYSVVYTDRSLNHMSRRFQQVMRDVSATLKEVYHARSVAIVPGSGSYGMEAVARQFVQGQRVLIVRNGWFSYRWSQIIEMGRMSGEITVHKARRVGAGAQAPFAAAPLDEVVESIRRERPQVVFCPHVETASGMILPDDYLRGAVRSGPCRRRPCWCSTAWPSGAAWVDMEAVGVDVLVSAPQKGWSGTPCAGLVMLNERAPRAHRFDHQRQLQLRPEEVARHHGDLRVRRARLSRHAADGRPAVPARGDERDARLRLRCRPQRPVRPSAAGCARCWPSGAFPASPRRASRRRAWWSATPRATIGTRARPLPRRACRSPPACRWPATKGPDLQELPPRAVRPGQAEGRRRRGAALPGRARSVGTLKKPATIQNETRRYGGEMLRRGDPGIMGTVEQEPCSAEPRQETPCASRTPFTPFTPFAAVIIRPSFRRPSSR